ncbi:adenine nucleotide alpha hydrolase [Ancylobacter oerskovii]|uniref:Adenine nucleotide alpha hydrolase n=1 Tax=Ancylobacter oerskovii TaxID=459519 RepID=A0ABW4YYP9_9HYPH|nr:adenine nucleotide alpha hydrolase [Ancylobacter oerskovii]MBS7541656.1 adenine nucleotide alpha hydrolase [Ancylobacter oerskovii]
MPEVADQLARLESVIAGLGPLAVAVSGGVDSMTLASVAHRVAPRATALAPMMIHAVSPAVPAAARALIEEHGRAEGWHLRFLDAGEQNDAAYRANPFNRCYFCKSNLYAAMRGATDRLLASGTNLDDLSDHRPGLIAAREHDVVHPFVTARIDKAAIRAITRHLGFTRFAELPAQPCLASRVETGIAIDPRDLAFIDRTERAVRARLGTGETVRVRVRRDGVHLEIARGLDPAQRAALTALLVERCAEENRLFAGIAPYRTGSAFVSEAAQ